MTAQSTKDCPRLASSFTREEIKALPKLVEESEKHQYRPWKRGLWRYHSEVVSHEIHPRWSNRYSSFLYDGVYICHVYRDGTVVWFYPEFKNKTLRHRYHYAANHIRTLMLGSQWRKYGSDQPSNTHDRVRRDKWNAFVRRIPRQSLS